MNMARKETLATPCIFLRERLCEQRGVGCLGETSGFVFAETKLCEFKRAEQQPKAVNTHSLSSSYMGRMAGWHTKAKVRMGTA